MKNYYKAFKILSGLSAVLSVMFAAAYIRGLYVFDNIYSLLDATLPFVPFIIASVIGFCAANAKCAELEAEEETAKVCRKHKTHRAPTANKPKKADDERRYIIKTYSRDGISKRHIHTRYACAMAKSA